MMVARAFILAGAGMASLGLAACNPPHPHAQGGAPLRTISALDCPASQGDLTRASATADGKTCVYTGHDGAQVTLQLISLDGKDAKTTLAPLEAQLQAELPAATGSGAAAVGATDNDRVDINLPGIHIHANGHDNKADVDAGGVHVHSSGATAQSDTGQASVVVGGGPGHAGVNIDAADSGAHISIDEPGSGVRTSVILASDKPGPHGYKAAGYEARGPSGGPLAVVSMLAKSDDHDDLRGDMRALLKRNVGG